MRFDELATRLHLSRSAANRLRLCGPCDRVLADGLLGVSNEWPEASLDTPFGPRVLSELRDAAELCDVELVTARSDGRATGERVGVAHGVLLAAVSVYFRARLTTTLPRPADGVYTLEDVDLDVARMFLAFVYGDSVRCPPDRVVHLLEFAHRYQVRGLQQQAASAVCALVDASNCVAVWELGDAIYCDELREAAAEKLESTFEWARHGPDFPLVDIDLLETVLSANSLEVEREDHVLDAIEEWMEANFPSPKEEDWKEDKDSDGCVLVYAHKTMDCAKRLLKQVRVRFLVDPQRLKHAVLRHLADVLVEGWREVAMHVDCRRTRPRKGSVVTADTVTGLDQVHVVETLEKEKGHFRKGCFASPTKIGWVEEMAPTAGGTITIHSARNDKLNGAWLRTKGLFGCNSNYIYPYKVLRRSGMDSEERSASLLALSTGREVRKRPSEGDDSASDENRKRARREEEKGEEE